VFLENSINHSHEFTKPMGQTPHRRTKDCQNLRCTL